MAAVSPVRLRGGEHASPSACSRELQSYAHGAGDGAPRSGELRSKVPTAGLSDWLQERGTGLNARGSGELELCRLSAHCSGEPESVRSPASSSALPNTDSEDEQGDAAESKSIARANSDGLKDEEATGDASNLECNFVFVCLPRISRQIYRPGGLLSPRIAVAKWSIPAPAVCLNGTAVQATYLSGLSLRLWCPNSKYSGPLLRIPCV